MKVTPLLFYKRNTNQKPKQLHAKRQGHPNPASNTEIAKEIVECRAG